MSMKDAWVKWGDTAWKVALLLGLIANLVLTQKFVTRSEYDRDQERYDEDRIQNTKEHLAIQSSIADIATTMKLMAANQSKIDDHEMRVRVLENRQVENIANVRELQRQLDKIGLRP